MTDTQIIDDRLDFSHKVYNHPSPQFLKLNPLGGMSAPTLSASSVVGPISFQVPAKVVNLSKSYFSFDMTIPSAGASNYTWLQGNTANMINRVVCSAVGSNTILADITNAGNYCESVGAHSTPLVEFFDKSTAVNTSLSASVLTAQVSAVDDISRVCSANNYTGYDAAAGSGSDLGTLCASQSSVRKLYLNSTVSSACAISVKLNLDAFKHTILALNKDMYYGGQMIQVDFYMEAANRYIFSSTSATNASTGAAAYTGSPSLQNVALILSVEQNVAIVNSIVQKVMSEGLTIPIPYVFNSKLNISSSTNHNFTLQISSAYGSKLLAVFWSPFANTETSNTQKGHTIYQLGLYNTYLNSIPTLTPSGINPAYSEHFYFNRDNLTGSAIAGKPDYDNAFTHIDNFTGLPLAELSKKGNYANGIDLTQGMQTWQLSLTTTASTSLNHYVFFVTQKTLTINSQAVLAH